VEKKRPQTEAEFHQQQGRLQVYARLLVVGFILLLAYLAGHGGTCGDILDGDVGGNFTR